MHSTGGGGSSCLGTFAQCQATCNGVVYTCPVASSLSIKLREAFGTLIGPSIAFNSMTAYSSSQTLKLAPITLKNVSYSLPDAGMLTCSYNNDVSLVFQIVQPNSKINCTMVTASNTLQCSGFLQCGSAYYDPDMASCCNSQLRPGPLCPK